MNFFNKLFTIKKETPEFSYNQAVILTIQFDSQHEFGTSKEREDLSNLEEKLTSSLPPNSGVDGHDTGEGQAIIYIYGTSAEEIWQKIRPTVKAIRYKNVKAVLQLGRPDDPNTRDVEVS